MVRPALVEPAVFRAGCRPSRDVSTNVNERMPTPPAGFMSDDAGPAEPGAGEAAGPTVVACTAVAVALAGADGLPPARHARASSARPARPTTAHRASIPAFANVRASAAGLDS